MLLNFFLKNCHATLSYCVQSHSKFSVTIYQNKIFVFAVALTDTQAKIHLKHCLHQHASFASIVVNQWRDDIHSAEQFCHTVKAALYDYI